MCCILPYPQIQPLGADSSRCVPSLQGLWIRFLLSDECRMGYFYTRIFWIGKIGVSQVISGTHNLQGAILCNYYLIDKDIEMTNDIFISSYLVLPVISNQQEEAEVKGWASLPGPGPRPRGYRSQ